MKIPYRRARNWHDKTRQLISWADEICEEYAAQGYVLTLRQLYYQLVARGLIPNRVEEYGRLGSVVNDARLAGLIDWTHLEDRTRNVQARPHWTQPADVLLAAAQSYHVDLWRGQGQYVEVWVEKEALVGVIENVCRRNDLHWFACKGYVSQSEMWAAAQRIMGRRSTTGTGLRTTVLHLGDHDPSGIHMSQDITDRLTMFCEWHDWAPPEVLRIALNMDQIRALDPPPNPAKETDSRFRDYQERFGDQSWELDALDPATLVDLIEAEVDRLRDEDQWKEDVRRMEREREQLQVLADRWSDVSAVIAEGDE